MVDLNQLVAGTERLLGRLIGEDIELVTRCTAATATVRADPGSLEQVLMNLAVNARDAMPRGGRLTIGTDQVVLDARDANRPAEAATGAYVVLTVTDTGSGIAQEHMPHVFEPFYTTKPQGHGTGPRPGDASTASSARQAGTSGCRARWAAAPRWRSICPMWPKPPLPRARAAKQGRSVAARRCCWSKTSRRSATSPPVC